MSQFDVDHIENIDDPTASQDLGISLDPESELEDSPPPVAGGQEFVRLVDFLKKSTIKRNPNSIRSVALARYQEQRDRFK